MIRILQFYSCEFEKLRIISLCDILEFHEASFFLLLLLKEQNYCYDFQPVHTSEYHLCAFLRTVNI